MHPHWTCNRLGHAPVLDMFPLGMADRGAVPINAIATTRRRDPPAAVPAAAIRAAAATHARRGRGCGASACDADADENVGDEAAAVAAVAPKIHRRCCCCRRCCVCRCACWQRGGSAAAQPAARGVIRIGRVGLRASRRGWPSTGRRCTWHRRGGPQLQLARLPPTPLLPGTAADGR
eukprot:364402-Chlamydomonas_euryale.AAC.3